MISTQIIHCCLHMPDVRTKPTKNRPDHIKGTNCSNIWKNRQKAKRTGKKWSPSIQALNEAKCSSQRINRKVQKRKWEEAVEKAKCNAN